MSKDTPTLAEVIRSSFAATMADMHVAIPAKVVSYDAETQQVDAKPLVKRAHTDEFGDRATESLPVVTGVPVVFPGGGGFRVTFPITKGDTVLLIFSEASIDKWLVRGDEVDPLDDRRHSLADGIAIPGLRPFSNPLTDAPDTYMSAGMDGGPVVEIDENEIRGGGSGAASLATKADIDALKTALDTHIHSGGTLPGGFTGTPTAPLPSASGTSVLLGK